MIKQILTLMFTFGIPIFASIWSMSIGNWKTGIALFLFVTIQFLLMIDDEVKRNVQQKNNL